jgi:hypothetical protein
VVEKGMESPDRNQSNEQADDLGTDILKLLNERAKTPADAFVLVQQLSIYLWSTYKIDWKAEAGQPGSETRKQRLLNFISGLMETMVPPEESHAAAPELQSEKKPE